MSESTTMYLIGGVFISLLVANAVIFSIRREPEFKRRYMPWAGVVMSLPLFALPIIQFWPSPVSLIIVFGFSLIVFLNFKLTKFCDKCGKFRYNRQMFEPMRFCSVCGEEFGD